MLLYAVVFILCTFPHYSLTAPPASIDSSGDPTWLRYQDIQDNQFKSPRVRRISSIASSSNADYKKLRGKSIWTVSVVTYREIIIGCHSFRDFLSPDYVTIFMFDKWLADPLYNMTAFVKSLTAKDTLAAHVIITDEKYGEVFDRKVAMDFLASVTKGLNIKFNTMFAINCDVHPVKSSFYLHKSLPNVAKALYKTMQDETKWRKQGITHIRNSNVRKKSAIFGVIPVIFEKDQPQNNAISSYIHGNDVDGFKNTYKFKKPSSMGSYPWVVDTLNWPEQHAILFDYALLQSVAKEYFSVGEYLAEQRVLPDFCKRHGMTMLRNNEVVVLFDLVPDAKELTKSVYQKIRKNFPMNEMLLRNYELVTTLRSPARLNTSYYDIKNRPIKVKQNMMYGPGFDAVRIKSHWIPSNVNGKTLKDEVGRRFFKAHMMMFGYYENMNNRDSNVIQYVMKRVYPTVFKMTVNYGHKHIGSLIQNGTATKLYSNDWKTYTFNGKKTCCTVACMNSLTLKERTFTFSKSAYLQDMQIAQHALNYETPRLVDLKAPFSNNIQILRSGGIKTSIYDTQAKLSP